MVHKQLFEGKRARVATGWKSGMGRIALAATLVQLVTGCALINWQPNDGKVETARQLRLVADDFAAMFAQLDATDPDMGPLAMSPPETDFGQALLLALRAEGYSVMFSNETAEDAYVRYAVDSQENQFGRSMSFSVSTSEIDLGRDYKTRSDGVYPISFMRVMGAASEHVILTDEQFQRQNINEELITGIAPDESFEIEVASLDTNAPTPLFIDESGEWTIDKNLVGRQNMYVERASNFKDFLSEFNSVNKNVLVFPNDSLRVLPEVRRTLSQMREEFQPETDYFSVIGCSHGNTNIDNGNELLAVGRSKRVLEELIAMGIPDERVLDEGCWAPVHFDGKMPRRGVVVELKRRSEG